MRKLLYIISYLLVMLFITSCAAPSKYYSNLNTMLSREQYDKAAELAKASREREYGSKNDLLYYLDRGMLLHLAGKYKESNMMFEKAKKTAEDHFTKSISTEASTFLVNDTMRPYYGEDFERALINIFSALNYINMGKESEALVEARQVDHFLKTLQTNYGHKNVYKEDAFARYLMGMIYENQGEVNDAFISYRHALETYSTYKKSYKVSPPRSLFNDIIRTGKELGFEDEIDKIEKEWKVNKDNLKKPSPTEGELVLFHYNGFAPVKGEEIFEISFGKGWAHTQNVTVVGSEAKQVEKAGAIARSIASKEQLRLAFPKYLHVNYNIDRSRVKVTNSSTAFESQGELVQNIGEIAILGLQDRITRIKTKTIARAAVRYALQKRIVHEVRKRNDDLVSFLAEATLKTINTAIEKADTRSWRSLPDKIYMHRVILPEGEHSVQMRFYDKNGSIVTTKNIDNIKIKAAKKTFVVVKTAL